jgi:RNA-directed DNA polymerase
MSSSNIEILFDKKVKPADREQVEKYIGRLADANLPVVLSPEHLQQILRVRVEQFYAISQSPDLYYREYYARKNNGGRRKISAPLPLLLFLQKWVLKNILELQPVHPAAKAYLKKSSIKQNARFHRKQNQLFKSDVKDFFGSISSNWVYQYFLGLGYSKAVSMLFTAICCKSNCLPQGAATSGYLSNIFMHNFDEALLTYCSGDKLRYTRYADDIAISGAAIDRSELTKLVEKELRKRNLKIHSGKTRLLESHQRQKVTGVVVNEKLGPGKDYLRALRKDLYYIEKYGIYGHARRTGWSSPTSCLNNVYGRLTHALFLLGTDQRLQQMKKDLETVFEDIDL